jgi:hypothetical protein
MSDTHTDDTKTCKDQCSSICTSQCQDPRQCQDPSKLPMSVLMSNGGLPCDVNSVRESKCRCRGTCTCSLLRLDPQVVGNRTVTDNVLEMGQFNNTLPHTFDESDQSVDSYDDSDDSSDSSDDDDVDDSDDDSDEYGEGKCRIYNSRGCEVDVVNISCSPKETGLPFVRDRAKEFLKYSPSQFLNMMTQTGQLCAGFSAEQFRGKTGWVVKMYITWLGCKYAIVSHFHAKKKAAKASVVDAFYIMASAQLNNKAFREIDPLVAYYVLARVPDLVNMFQNDLDFSL